MQDAQDIAEDAAKSQDLTEELNRKRKKKIMIVVAVLFFIVLVTVVTIESEKYGFALVMSKLIGSGIVIFSVFMKVPQIMKIWKATSVEGLTATMFYLDYMMLL